MDGDDGQDAGSLFKAPSHDDIQLIFKNRFFPLTVELLQIMCQFLGVLFEKLLAHCPSHQPPTQEGFGSANKDPTSTTAASMLEGGQDVEITSSMGTSTAVAMTSTATEQIYDRIFDLLKSYLAPN